MERIKLFSKEEPRIKLFGGERIKLFSSSSILSCSDCGYKLEGAGWITNQVCPKCGGTRFNSLAPEKVIGPEEKSEDKDTEEVDFQKEFTNTSDDFEIKLREFSGHTFTGEEIQKEFGITGEDLIEKGYSESAGEDSYIICQDAFLKSRLFSNLRVSITKTLELDPSIVCGKPEDGIARLEEISDLCPKSIMILKKAHGIDTNSWLSDSGILGDLKLEMGGKTKPRPEFEKIIEERYPDAPEGIMEILEKNGIIRPSGENTIEIIK